VQRTVIINAPAEAVWAVLVDVERWPEWTPTIHSAVLQTPPPFGLHSVALLEVRGRSRPEPWTVNAFEAGRSFSWQMRAGPGLRVVAGHVVEPHEGRSRVTLSIDTRGPLGMLAAPFVSRASAENVETEAAGLKRRCEGGN
jgi:hypothetical protein